MSALAPPQDVVAPPYVSGMTHLSTYDDVAEVLRSRSFRQGSHQESMPFFEDALLMLDGDDHFRRRRLEAALFAKEALLHYEKQMLQPAIERCMALLGSDRDDQGRARGDLVTLTRDMLLQMTAAITGMDGVDTPEATRRFGDYLGALGEGVTVEWSTEDHDAVIARVMEVREDFIEDFYAPSVARRQELVERHARGELAADGLPHDLATLLLLRREPDWDVGVELRETTLYLVAGFQTTTHATPHLVNHLLGWFAEHPEDRGRAQDWDFLQRAASESLRLHLPAPSLLRIATEDVVLASGRTIAAGDRVALLVTPANRDPDVFGDDADRFDPWRDTTGAVKPWALSFGGGIHTCIGRQLVTGLSRTLDEVGDTEHTTAGIITQIAAELFRRGVEVDPERPWRFREVSHHDAFDAYPVVFSSMS